MTKQKSMPFFFILLAVFCFVVTGCASPRTSRTVLYEEKEQKYSIFATVNTSGLRYEVNVFVNDVNAANGYLGAASTSSNFVGKYKKKKVDAECKTVNTGGILLSVFCNIFLDSKKAAEFTW